MKFKVGDRVRARIDESFSKQQKNEGTVIEVDDTFVVVENDNGFIDEYYPEQLELMTNEN